MLRAMLLTGFCAGLAAGMFLTLVQQVRVITGLGAGSQIEIFGEIQAGDQVVIRGAERLEDGMSVSIGGNQALVLGNSKADP